MASIKERKQKIADWLTVVNDEDTLGQIENLMKNSSKEYYNRYLILGDDNTLENIVREGEADIAAKRYISHKEVKKLFSKNRP